MRVFFDLVQAIHALRPLRQAEQGRAGQIQVPMVDHRPHLGEKERHQKRRDMGAVHVRVGHDDDLVIAQVVHVEFRPQTHAKRLGQIRNFRVGAEFRRRSTQHVQDLAAQGKKRLGLAVPRHFGGAARAVALHDKQLGSVAVGRRTIDQLAGQAQLLRGGFARGFFLHPAAQPFFGPQHQKIEDRACGFRVCRKPVVKVVAD
mmetsp:Transcript_23799/g.42852  ORF Transcript_23799/g.42852 Transcript_23799/m.42852 type:complete len:202 (-) Transcript_23799:3695-4300(-)